MVESENKKLNFDGTCNFLSKFSRDFENLTKKSSFNFKRRTYKFTCSDESSKVERLARTAALKNVVKPIKKVAFDTRRINQHTERNPRTNAQYWNRTDPFITKESQEKINVFSKLMSVLKEIKGQYGSSPEFHESYARVLHDDVERILRVKIGDNDIAEPQLAYLEQIMFLRYRLSMDDILNNNNVDIKRSILEKDENLLKRGLFMSETKSKRGDTKVVKSNSDNNEKYTAAISSFLDSSILKNSLDGKKQKTITITINVKED